MKVVIALYLVLLTVSIGVGIGYVLSKRWYPKPNPEQVKHLQEYATEAFDRRFTESIPSDAYDQASMRAAIEDFWGCIGATEMTQLDAKTVELAKANHKYLSHEHTV